MAHDYYMDLDNNGPTSSPPPTPHGARYKNPSPTNPGLRQLLRERQEPKLDHQSRRFTPLSILDTPPVRQIGDPSHPARARAVNSRSPLQFSPSYEIAVSDIGSLVADTVIGMKARSDLKSAKSSKARPTHHRSSSRVRDGGISKQYSKDQYSIGREHTSVAIPSTSRQTLPKSRLKPCATDPAIPAVLTRRDQAESLVAGSSRLPANVLLKSRITEPEYDFPSNTPTPPARSCVARRSSTVSSGSPSTDSQGASPLASSSPSPRGDDVCRRHSGDDEDVSVAFNSFMVDHRPDEHSTPLDALMKPPPPAPHGTHRTANNVRRAPSPVLPKTVTQGRMMAPPCIAGPSGLARPFAPPSQIQRPSQSEQARASQRPRALGMLRGHAQGGKFQTKSKPFKVPFAKPVAPSTSSESGRGQGVSSRRSLSPVIPDPPYVLARAQSGDTNAEATQCITEMSARPPEPIGEDDDLGNIEADSSGDLWANVPDIDDYGDVP